MTKQVRSPAKPWSRWVLPVVSRANARIMLGVVTLPDILKAYGVENAEDLDYKDHPDV